MLNLMRRNTSKLVTITLSLAIALSPVSGLMAQTDTEAPVLIHRQIDSGVAGELQTFLARVSDDYSIENVTLHYRQDDSGEFKILQMRPLIDSIGEYMIAVETERNAYPGMQYFIEATDTSGNKANRGYAYAPIVLPLTAPTTTNNETPGPIVDVSSPTPTPTTESTGLEINPTYILAGLGALIALGALASSGGGDTDPTPTTPTPGPNTVTLTIISDVPTVE